MNGWSIINILPIMFIVLMVVLVLFILYKCSYVKVPVDKAAVITGVGKQRVLVGRCGWKIPFFDSVCYVSLENIPLQINVGAIAKGNINVKLNGTAVVKIGNDPESVVKATERFCNNGAARTIEKIQEITEPIIEGALRGSAAELSPEEINEDREKFEVSVKGNIIGDLAQMGLYLDSYTLNDIETPDGYFKNKTEPKMAESQSLADIAKAERARDADIKTANASREAQSAKIAAETEIAKSSRDKNVALEGFKAEEAKAKVEAEASAKIKTIEKNKEIEAENASLAEIQAQRKEKELIAQVIKPAEAEKQRQEVEAQAKANVAVTEAKARAEAVKAQAEAEAEAIRLKGIAEAEAIKAKALAEAEGIKEKAKAFAQYNDAAKLDLLAPVIAEIGKANAESLKAIDKVTIVDGADGAGVSSYSNNVMKSIASSMQVVEDLTGVNPKEMIEKDYKKEFTVHTDRQ